MVDAVAVGARGASTGSSVATTAGATNAGETLIAIVSHDPGVTITSISDTAGNSFSLIANNVSGFARLAAYRCENAAGHPSNVLTVNFSGAAFAVAHFIRCTDVGASSYDASSMVSSTDATSPFEITSNALAQADNVVIACCEANRAGGANPYASSNTTIISSEPDVNTYWTSAVSKVVVASPSAVLASFTKDSSSGANALIIFAIRRGSGAPAGSVVVGTPQRNRRSSRR